MNKIIYALGIIIPFGLMLIFVYELIKNRFWFKKKVMLQDKELKYFLYEEFDTPATQSDVDSGKATYNKNGRLYVENSGKENIQDSFMRKMEAARHEVGSRGIVFSITSGFRSREYNATLKNSVANSAHVLGYGADISMSKYSEEQKAYVLSVLRKYFVRIGKANTFFHVDNDGSKPQTEWTY